MSPSSDAVPAVTILFPTLRAVAQESVPKRDDRGPLLQDRASQLRSWSDAKGFPSDAVKLLPAVGAIIVDSAIASMQADTDVKVVINYALPDLIRFVPKVPALGWVQRKPPVRSPQYAPVIGMIDTGIASHNEFGKGQVSCIQLDGAGNVGGGQLIDDSGHGTFVGAIIAGNSSGVMPGATLAVASVMARKPSTYADFVAGVDWLVGGRLQDGVASGPFCDLINISGGTTVHDGSLYDPLWEAYSCFGVLCVAGTGNDGRQDQVDSPADFDFCLGIGSHDSLGAFYVDGTDWGTTSSGYVKPDLCAEGVAVVSAGTKSPKDYVSDTGTSFATALVSGAIARLFATQPDLPLNPAKTTNALTSYCIPLDPAAPWLSKEGRLDLPAIP